MRLPLFIRQKLYEQIIYQIRRSLITLAPTFFWFFILLGVPVVVRWFINLLFPTLLNQPILFVLGVLLTSIYYLSITLFFFSYFIDFYLDLLVVTNDRLVDIKQTGFFSRTVIEVDLYQIQDITSQINGFFPSLFNYGTLTIQTAGPIGHFMVSDVPNPNALRRAILDLAEKDVQHHFNK